MANRYAPFKSMYLTRSPKHVVAKFTVVAHDAATLTKNDAPFNEGIVSINHTATGVYQFHLGAAAAMRDTYAKLAGIQCTFSEAQRQAFVSNDQSSNTTTPFVEITVCANDAAAVNVANSKTMMVDFLFLDSVD